MLRWFKQYFAIAGNAFVVTMSDPVFLVLILLVLAAELVLACLPTFNFGEELRLIRDQSLALIFIGGCVAGLAGIAATVVRDLREGVVSILMSRPVSSLGFVCGKFTGLAGALLVYQVTVSVGCLWVTRIAGAGHGGQHLDMLALAYYAAGILVPLAAIAVKHYLFGGWFAWQATLAVAVGFTLLFLLLNGFSHGEHGSGVDWITAQGCVMILLAQLSFAAILVPLAMVADMVMLMVGGVAVFFLGLLSEFIANSLFGADLPRIAAKAVVPNWQIYWVADILAQPEGRVAVSYIFSCTIHSLAYACFCLFIAALIFDRREFSGREVA